MKNLIKELFWIQEKSDKCIYQYAMDKRIECVDAIKRRQDMFCEDISEAMCSYYWPSCHLNKEQLTNFIKRHFQSFLDDTKSWEEKHKYRSEIYSRELNIVLPTP